MSEIPDSVSREGTPKDYLNEQLKESYDQRRQDVKIPEGISEKVLEGINFALSCGAAKSIDGHDLYHVHLCIPQRKVMWKKPDYGGWDGDPKLVLKKFENDPDTVLLFHSQEFVNNPTKNRNIVIEGDGGKPRVIQSTEGVKGITPNQLGTFTPFELCFITTPDGPYTLDNGKKIDIFLYDFNRK